MRRSLPVGGSPAVGKADMVAKSREENRPYAVAIDFAQAYGRRELILELACRLADHTAVERVWLFGSPVRGDYFAPFGIDLDRGADAGSLDWLELSLDFEEDAPTLLCIDLVRMEKAPEHLREQNHDEGIVIHERSRAEATV